MVSNLFAMVKQNFGSGKESKKSLQVQKSLQLQEEKAFASITIGVQHFQKKIHQSTKKTNRRISFHKEDEIRTQYPSRFLWDETL